MRPHPIIVVYSLVHLLADLLEVHPFTFIQPPVLYGVVHPLGQRIVQRIPRLSHTDEGMIVKEFLCIFPAGILYSSVGVVYHAFDVYPPIPIEVQSHL